MERNIVIIMIGSLASMRYLDTRNSGPVWKEYESHLGTSASCISSTPHVNNFRAFAMVPGYNKADLWRRCGDMSACEHACSYSAYI